MTKKDYIKFAQMFKERKEELERLTSENMRSKNPDGDKQVYYDAEYYENERIAHATADIFQSDNPNFNRVLFLNACGILDKR